MLEYELGNEVIADYCRLCGEWRKMTYEHVPPERAFNDRPRLFQSLQDKLRKRNYTKYRKGIGLYSLCEQCNNTTGGNYGGAFVEWAKQGLEWLELIAENDIETFTFTIQPLNVLKQVCTMAIASMSIVSLKKHEDLRRFVFNKDSQYMPYNYGIYVYLAENEKPRFASDIVTSTFSSNSVTMVYLEIAIPPFGYCVVSQRSGISPEKIRQHRLYPIEWFWGYALNETATVELRLPKLPVNTVFPLDYRTETQVVQEMIDQEIRSQIEKYRQ